MLPHQSPRQVFLTDGGLETSLIFHDGIDLPDFAAFTLLADPEGVEALRRYFAPYVALARERGTGFVVDTPTWRASRDWGERLGYNGAQLAEANRQAVAFAREIAAGLPPADALVTGIVGPRGDGYVVGEMMSAQEAADYHGEQIAVFAEAGVDLVSAMTVTYAEEGIGVARAAREHGVPAVVSFTVETDGRLPSGQKLAAAVRQVDADARPAYFMLNCAHPTHVADVLARPGDWRERIGGLRANASRMSHAELDEAEVLDEGDPAELGAEYADLRRQLPAVNVLGGCCGTDSRHVAAIAAAWTSASSTADA